MNLQLSPPERAFQLEVRSFIASALPEDLRAAGRSATSVFSHPRYSLPWQRILHERGWAAPSWPVEFGGTGWSETWRHIFAVECATAGAPSLAPMGLRMVGPCIIRFGTPEQRSRYLPRILSGEDYWCQGYSEPQAGSDLAALQLRATVDEDSYVLDGTKLWTTHAQFANLMFCLVRTNSEAKPQKGITFLLVDMATAGVTVKPIITLAGEHEVNQVFFDSVRVPRSQRLGEENEGWTVAKTLLEFERGGAYSAGLKVSLGRLRAAGAEARGSDRLFPEDAGLGARIAAAEILVDAIEATERRVLSALAAGVNPGSASSMLKTVGVEAMQLIDELWVEASGLYAAVDQPDARQPNSNVSAVGPHDGLLAMPRYLNNRAGSIYGGSNEIQRNIMARLILGL
jgi:acyl-CoA dehydrogenase